MVPSAVNLAGKGCCASAQPESCQNARQRKAVAALVIFDLDFTLIDAEKTVRKGIEYAMKKTGEKAGVETIMRYIGIPLEDMLAKGGVKDAKKAGEAYRELYGKIYLKETVLYPGVREKLEEMHSKGIVLALMTAKRQDFAEGLLRHFGLMKVFSVVLGAQPGLKPKPAPDGINKIVEKVGVDKGKTFMVGDTEIDIIAAENAGVNAIGVLTGLSYWRSTLEKHGGRWPMVGSVAEIDVERHILGKR